jgi:Putative peptidoglycan binding domain/L,D-transpeptidase catalytic domain
MHTMTRLTVTGVATVLIFAGTTIPASALTAAQVKYAQTRLNRLGCQSGPADGRVGPMTRAATVRFQSANRLSQTGTLNNTTYYRLRSATAKRCDLRPVPARSGSGRRIVMSQSQNWIWVIDSRGKLIRTGGIIDNPDVLRPGTYYTGSKCGRPGRVRNNSDGGRLILHNFVRFAPCGIGMHQIPTYRSTGRQIHPDWLLGTNYRESHGCVRVSRSMSDTIWSFTTVRTKVVVVR